MMDIRAKALVIHDDNIDTDVLYPGQYLNVLDPEEARSHLFEGLDPKLRDLLKEGDTVLFVGENFGCGSSREHAPQALQKHGIRAVVAEGFAEIFLGNSTTLGMPCVTASREDIGRIAAAVDRDPKAEVVIDLVGKKVTFAGQSAAIEIRESVRDALVNGRWDPIGELSDGAPDAVKVASNLQYMLA